MRQVYLDYNASTPIADEVSESMLPYLTSAFGNPSSGHWAGAPAKEAVERARDQVASLLGCDPSEVVFTSGGTEANNHALKGTFYAAGGRGHIITTAVEHPAVIRPCRFLERLGAVQVSRKAGAAISRQLLGDHLFDSGRRNRRQRDVVLCVDGKRQRWKPFGRQPESASSEIEPSGHLRVPELAGDMQQHPLRAIQRLEFERKRADLGALNDLDEQVGSRVVHTGEVKIGREATGIARAELADGSSAFQRDTQLEDSGFREMGQQMILGYIDDRRPASSFASLVVAN